MSAKIGEEPGATNIRTLMIEATDPAAILNRYQTTRHEMQDSDVHISLRKSYFAYPPILF
jgi:hypothetical protein